MRESGKLSCTSPLYRKPSPSRRAAILLSFKIQKKKKTNPFSLLPTPFAQGARRRRRRPRPAMRKARATAAASKPKPRATTRAKPKPKPKAKPSPSSLLSGGSSPASGDAADDLSFLSPSSPVVKPKTRSPLAAPASSPISPYASPATASASVSVSTVADLRSLAASHLDSLKRRLDALHGDSARDLEASHSRISKRFKMQTQSCLQLADEAEKEHRKMAEKISEHAEAVKASYKKFVAEVQASTSRVCKVTIPEMAKSADRAIDGLRSRYNIPATAA
uniref:Uncharacterized protein n=1 Tax=Oryza meridionalis TaxID=40149 RepID=A0A0E0EIP6_9ORYZ